MNYKDHFPAVWIDAALSIIALCRVRADGSESPVESVVYVPCDAGEDMDIITIWFNPKSGSGIDIPVPTYLPGADLAVRLENRLLPKKQEEVGDGKGEGTDSGRRVAGRKPRSNPR